MLEKAQEKVAGLQTLTVELERQLEEEREERENLVATWDQEMADLQAQVSYRHREHAVSLWDTAGCSRAVSTAQIEIGT